jgi:hypothetical protein
MKVLHWRWRGVPAVDALEEACTRDAPEARPSARTVLATLQAAAARADERSARLGCFQRFLPRAFADCAALPAALLQSAQYALARNAVMRPSWYITRPSGQHEPAVSKTDEDR